mmetsp:Transcript_36000/g.67023  ORF Transcript_36000/g.67023 Transcript_36000/m.67023 type:complete len:386 (+) Transcript_36000:49-1206(+)
MDSNPVAEAADGALSTYAQWLADSFARTGDRQDQLTREISAVREAAAVGAHALVELRSAVQDQLDGVLSKFQRLEQELEATKLELAEVVIDKEGSENELKNEVEALKQMIDVQSLSVLLKQLQDSQVESLERKIAEAVEKESALLRQQMESKSLLAEEKALQKAENVRESVEKKLEDSLLEKVNMDLFSKMDAVMDHLTQAQVELETQHKDIIDRVESFRRSLDETSDRSRRISSLHELLEPRVTAMEEWRENTDGAILQLHSDLRDSVKEARTPVAATQPTTPNSVKVPSTDGESRHASAGSCQTDLARAAENASLAQNMTSVQSKTLMAPVPAPPKAWTTDGWRFTQASAAPKVWTLSAPTVRIPVIGAPAAPLPGKHGGPGP